MLSTRGRGDAAEDAGGAALARRVRARHDRPAEGQRHHPQPHPAPPVPPPADGGARGARPRTSSPTPGSTSVTMRSRPCSARVVVRRATRSRRSSRSSPPAAWRPMTPRSTTSSRPSSTVTRGAALAGVASATAAGRDARTLAEALVAQLRDAFLSLFAPSWSSSPTGPPSASSTRASASAQRPLSGRSRCSARRSSSSATPPIRASSSTSPSCASPTRRPTRRSRHSRLASSGWSASGRTAPDAAPAARAPVAEPGAEAPARPQGGRPAPTAPPVAGQADERPRVDADRARAPSRRRPRRPKSLSLQPAAPPGAEPPAAQQPAGEPPAAGDLPSRDAAHVGLGRPRPPPAPGPGPRLLQPWSLRRVRRCHRRRSPCPANHPLPPLRAATAPRSKQHWAATSARSVPLRLVVDDGQVAAPTRAWPERPSEHLDAADLERRAHRPTSRRRLDQLAEAFPGAEIDRRDRGRRHDRRCPTSKRPARTGHAACRSSSWPPQSRGRADGGPGPGRAAARCASR